MNEDVLAKVCDEVEAVFVKHGGLSAADMDAVFSRLRCKAHGQQPVDHPKVAVAKCIPDLIHTNLEHALESYDWTGYAPVAMPNGKVIEAILALDANGTPPAGYRWQAGKRVLQQER